MSVAIVTDSGSDLTREEASRYGIEIVPVYVVFGNDRLRDGVEIDRASFFRRVESGEKPTTDPATVEDFTSVFDRLVASGRDVVAITLSSQISKSYEHVQSAASAYGEKVRVVDSRGASGLESLLAVYAAERAAAGDPAAEIARKLSSLKTAAFFAVPDLSALGQSGRLPKAVVALGSMLNVSLVLKMNDQGAIAPAGQSRSFDKTCELMVESVVRAIERSPGAWIAISYGGDAKVAKDLTRLLESKLGHPPVKEMLHETTLTIAANLGNSGVGIFAIVP